ncbi:MAG: hypothetical protein JWR40_2486 [Massilia sp.]|nr:hypothetical protein [Massilia sp.]MDB5952950.1 hypothetical protein [Massilia sp.]
MLGGGLELEQFFHSAIELMKRLYFIIYFEVDAASQPHKSPGVDVGVTRLRVERRSGKHLQESVDLTALRRLYSQYVFDVGADKAKFVRNCFQPFSKLTNQNFSRDGSPGDFRNVARNENIHEAWIAFD